MASLTWDKEQLEIINTNPSAHILVEAGPGMGKTAVACARVANLLTGGEFTGYRIGQYLAYQFYSGCC